MRSLSDFTFSGELLLLIGAGAFAIALTAVLVMKAGMNRARPQNSAHEYVKSGSFIVRETKDIYLYETTTKTPRPRSSSGTGGGRAGGGRPGGGVRTGGSRGHGKRGR
ncbi:MAG: hypothetical protein LBL37_09190 [Gracilibacteraceae bacterium]|jgi:uncharacterized protein|nr:hypothetical protein [Gracilibacteraceae bacterium]